MTLKFRHLAWVLAWGGAAYGLLGLGSLPGDLGHSLFGDALCGPWGCMPPLQALVALHGLWFLVLLPPAVWVARRWPAPRLRLIGCTLVAIGTLGLVIVAAREAATWLPSLPDDQVRYFPHRVAYVVATLTDVPLTQLALAGIVCWIVGRLRPTRGRLASTGNEPTRLEPAAATVSVATPSSQAPAGNPFADDAPPQRLPEPSGE